MGAGASADRVTNSPPKSVEKSKKEKKNEAAKTQQKTSKPAPQGRDVMISYSHADKEMMIKLQEGLEANGISVWVDMIGLKAGADFLSKIGQAIIDAKCVISLLSEKTIESKYCQDELALAYVSSKPIFPVGLKTEAELFPKMDTGMKLQLARYKWHLFLNVEEFDANLENLVTEIKAAIEQIVGESTELAHHDTGGAGTTTGVPLQKKNSNTKKGAGGRQTGSIARSYSKENENMSDEHVKSFWERNFGKEEIVSWEQFMAGFDKDYESQMKMLYGNEDLDWVKGIIRRELNVDYNEDMVLKESYIEMCTVDGEFIGFWYCVQDEVVQSYTMKEVFNMDSSVRVEAIENLGKFHSNAVIEALLDLLSDKDNNVRTVAAISLARTGANSPRVIKVLRKTLNDKDRLVRESGCLALGHIKAEAAVPDLVKLWRNDFISSVREAAQLALEQIGGQEAEKAMHMTKVLAEEIKELTKE